MREADFRIDVFDEYMIHVEQQPLDCGCVALLHKIGHFLKTMIPLHQIAYEIQDIKSPIRGIKERSERYGFQRSFEQGLSNCRGRRNAKWHDPRVASLHLEDIDFVAFKAPRKRLIDWRVKERKECIVV